MAFIDYYKVLGIAKSATQEDIKKAYRKMAKKFHPDINKDDPAAKERFQEINEANEVLGDPEKRRKYDEYGERWRQSDEFEAQRRQQNNQYGKGYNYGGFGSFGDFTSNTGNSSEFSDFFEQLFGSRFRQSSKRKGEDINASLTLTLREAATTHKQIFGIEGEKTSITIPAGIADGQKIKIKGRGGKSLQGAERGDLYITIHITPDNTFTRDGDDLYTTITTDMYTMLLGGEAIVPTLAGNAKVNIKPGTQPDSKLRLRGKGFPVYRQEGRFGDLIVTIKVQLPTLNERQKKLLKEMKG